ncbi:MAG: FAD-dependent oxidoreductase [Candidatus Lokiarchaeota archaeon]
MEEYNCEILIIGAGPAGLNAAVYTSRAGRDTIVLSGKEESALGRAKEIKNWIGEEDISGRDLLEKFKSHASSLENVRVIEGDVISLMLGLGKNMVSTRTANISADAIIIATGRGHRKEVIKGEENLIGYGVSYCALCDGPLYKEKEVYLYGSDEEVVEDGLTLQQMGCLVNIITPLNKDEVPEDFQELEGSDINVNFAMKIIEAIPNSDVDALFIFSHIPSNSIFKKAGVELDEKGNIKVDEEQKTNLKGVYAAGDVTGGLYQIVFSAAEGARAGINAAKYVRHLEKS